MRLAILKWKYLTRVAFVGYFDKIIFNIKILIPTGISHPFLLNPYNGWLGGTERFINQHVAGEMTEAIFAQHTLDNPRYSGGLYQLSGFVCSYLPLKASYHERFNAQESYF